MLDRLRSPLGLLVILGVLGLAGGAMWALAPENDPLAEVERLKRSGDEAGATTARITRNLSELADHLEGARGLEARSAEIGELTVDQRRSLENLVALLEEQLEQIGRTSRSISGAEGSASGLVEISDDQAALVASAVESLERLERVAREAGLISADFARRATYGAELAEDSQENFSSP
ncbi:MAG: hypothetical protein ACRDK3_08580 [Actinomycetota bacterium]